MSLEDHIHQAFSALIKSRQQGKDVFFEGEQLPPSRGPIDELGRINLSGSCGILGYSHPLITKAYFHLGARGTLVTEIDLVKNLLEEINNYISQILGIKVFLKRSIQSGSPQTGRVSSFLTREELDLLQKGEDIPLRFMTGDSFAITQKADQGIDSTDSIINFSSLYILRELFRFLSLGQFYGDNGLIVKREKLLHSILKEVKGFHCVNGLIVTFKAPLQSKHVICHDKDLIFPLSFDEDTLKTLVKVLKEDGCI